MSGTGRPRITFPDLLREYERRDMHEARRPAPSSAADLLGPGLAPQAVQLSDWSDDSIGFTGFYYSQPGALNSPDPALFWIGTSITDPAGTGVQRVTAYDDGQFGIDLYPAWPGVTYTRGFNTAGGTSRLYSAWVPERRTWNLSLGFDAVVTGTSAVNLGLTQVVDTFSTLEVYRVDVCLDVEHTGTLTRPFIGELWVGGVVQAAGMAFNAGGLDGARTHLSKTWLVSPLTPGATQFRVTGRIGTSADTYTAQAVESTMSMERVV